TRRQQPRRNRSGSARAHHAVRRRTGRHRPRVLRWPHVQRSRAPPRATGRHRQEPHPFRAVALARRPHRRGGARMTTTSPRPETDALLGAYVLDAVDVDERVLVDAYLDENPSARDEVDDLLETVALLASAPLGDTNAPPELWDRIEAQLDGAPTDEL